MGGESREMAVYAFEASLDVNRLPSRVGYPQSKNFESAIELPCSTYLNVISVPLSVQES